MSAGPVHVGVHDATIRLPNGHYWDYKHPDAGCMDIESVATALSNTCRFTGLIETFYSVAQHCWLASYIVPRPLALLALCHEPEEPVTGDLNKPFKVLIDEMTSGQFGQFVKRQERPILRKVFGLDPDFPKPPEIKRADLRLLATEKRDFGPKRRAVAWDARGFACEWEPMPEDFWTGLEHVQPLPQPLVAWTPSQARAAFLHRFVELRFGTGSDHVEQVGTLAWTAKQAAKA